jgi:hypothetical protein
MHLAPYLPGLRNTFHTASCKIFAFSPIAFAVSSGDIGCLVVADAYVTVFDMVVDCLCERHVESFRDHDLQRVVWVVSDFEYEFLEPNLHVIGDIHCAPFVSIAVVHGVL